MKFEPERCAEIIKHVEYGCYLRDAAALSDVSYEVVRQWRNRGRSEAAGEYHDFALALDKAEANGIKRHVGSIQGHAIKDWRASAWHLATRHPDRYSLSEGQHRALSAIMDEFILAIRDHMSPEAYDELCEAMETISRAHQQSAGAQQEPAKLPVFGLKR